MNRRIIGITGRARHGKDSIAEMLCSPRYGFCRVGFADALKDAA